MTEGKGKGKTVDFLAEDPVIHNQVYSLISVVGPHMPQKCSVWGIKVRGSFRTQEEAKKKAVELSEIDNDYDIYTVETGKFVPLVVDPDADIETEHLNEELNTLIKSYKSSKEKANREWEANKQKQVEEATREGKEGVKRTPIMLFATSKSLEAQIKTVEESLKQLNESLIEYTTEFESLSDEEKNAAVDEFNKTGNQFVS
jgi:hypothetical protein